MPAVLSPLVQIVGPSDNWVLERLARRLASKLPYAEFVPWRPCPTATTQIAYYLNYALFQQPSGLIDVAFFTHLDDSHQFLERARRVDACICMARKYADWLRDQGVQHVWHIGMGFDFYRYQPRLVLGVIGMLDHPRKGRSLVERLRQLPFVQLVTTEGRVPEEDLAALYQRLDYVLIPATVEGGPMSLLEGMAMGKPVLAPDQVGIVGEFADSPYIRRYPAGNAEALVQLVTVCYQQKLQARRLVRDRTWDQWAEGHHRLFMHLLRERGLTPPQPGPGFRFGLLGELDIPPGLDVKPLEAALDRVGAALFFGHTEQARSLLEEIVKRYPCATELLSTFPFNQDRKNLKREKANRA